MECSKFNKANFMDEVQKYPALYDKFNAQYVP